jgi:hypothetical protein
MRSRFAVWSTLLALAGTSAAHHSGAMFDRSQTVTLVGTVKEYQFTNPHVWIEVLVPGKDGAPVQWSIEGEAPLGMARMGLKPKTLKAGDAITIKAHPLRDGRTGGSFISVVLSDGTTIGMGALGSPPPQQAAPPAP